MQPPPFYHYEPSLTSLQIRPEVAENLKKNDDYWTNRIRQLEKRHEKIKQGMEEEFKKAMDELEIRMNVVARHKKHPKEPMKCAKEVQAFTECVDSKRVWIVDEARCAVKKFYEKK
ncbi:hypothetical protein Trydic_g14419 [Trypoxylus dichotomus]